MLQNTSVVVRKVKIFVIIQSAMHDLEQLFLSWIIDLSDLCFYLIEPVFNRVQLWRIRRKIEYLHSTLLPEAYSLLLIVDCAVVKHEPLLSSLSLVCFLFLSQTGEELFDEIEIFVLSVGSLDDSPMSESVFSYDGDKWKAFSLWNGAVDSDFLIRPCPSLIPRHVKVETAFV